jgi:phosphoglycolate phosphatase
MNLFFDLDGTLINAQQRMYLLFQHLISDSKLSFDEYWALKRNKKSHKEILMSRFRFSESDFIAFDAKWMAQIELEEWLAVDKPFDGVTDFLRSLREHHNIYVVTARQSKKNLHEQIINFEWKDIFEEVLVTENKKEKVHLIQETVDVHKDDWFIGDTGKDIQTGKLLGIKTAAVLSGFLGKEQLLSYEPDIIVEAVTDLDFKII